MERKFYEIPGMNHHVRYLDDWLEFISFAERVHAGRDGTYYNGLSCASLWDVSEDWAGTYDLKSAVELAYRGWPEGLTRVGKFDRSALIVRLAPQTRKIVALANVYGDEPDIDRYLAGEPENMLTQTEVVQSQPGRVIRLLINRAVPANIESERIISKGIGILTAVELLILLGYSVEITLVFATIKEETHYEYYVPILHAGDPINLDTFAFMMMHPAVLRRLGFAFEECESRSVRIDMGFHYGAGYGKPTEPLYAPECDLLLKWDSGLDSDEDAIGNFVESILNDVGVHLR